MMKKRTAEEIKAALDNPEFVYVNIHGVWKDKEDPKTGEMLKGGFILDWGAKKIGFGQITFKQNAENDDVRKITIECETECMGEKFVRQAIEHFMKNVKIVE